MKPFLFLFLVTLVACHEQAFKEGKEFAGKNKVSAQTLNLGKSTYMEYCVSCHGDKGDGKGVAAKGMDPIPRDFTLGLYKFGQVPAGELPHDADFSAIIKKGLHGTAMLPWDISEERIHAVTQYIKTFAPKVWEAKEAVLGERIIPTKDPYGLAHKTTAIEKGKEVYHVTAQCTTCHRAFIPKKELSALWEKVNKEKLTVFDPALYLPKVQDSEYGVKIVPPDFTWHNIRSASSVEELYVRIASGVSGSGMPPWKGTIEDHEIWATAYYVKSLMDLKDKPERADFLKSIEQSE
ncbi:MAG: c-type cytochrome [Bacteriovoracaceae bacterium]|nr:c-type cytochrome [Bacteriovoracaceae bacterium]